ncbi:MAG: hypothetical protein GY754_33550 [bacterium]|nr:hypothetical protein [bacterium]
MKPFFSPEPVIFAKGGGVPGSTPNTFSAFEESIELGADVIATNIELTGDNRVVLTASRDAVDDGKTKIEYNTLEEMLEAFPEQRFNIDLITDNDRLAYRFCEIVKKTGSENRILAASFHGRSLSIIRGKIPEMATSFSLMGMVGFYALFRTGILNFRKKFKPDALQMPESIGPSYFANAGLIYQAREKGLRVHILNVTDRKQIRRLSESGVDGFFTDSVPELSVILGR